jgi:DNA anti-recombination protein RmuC
MSAILIAGLLIVAALVVWVALRSRHQKKEVIESQMTNCPRSAIHGHCASASRGTDHHLTNSVTQSGHRRRSLTDGVAQSADISAKSQTAMREELKSTQGMMERIYKQLGEFQEVSRGLSNAQQSLEAVLGGAKTRGILGEVTLERLLEDSLPPSQYATQFRFASGEAVDADHFPS